MQRPPLQCSWSLGIAPELCCRSIVRTSGLIVQSPAPLARRGNAGAAACRRLLVRSSITSTGAGTPEDPDRIPDVALASESQTAPGPPEIGPADNDGEPRTAWQRVKRFFGGDKLDRQRLAALGLGAVASYGFVSNVTYGGGMAVAWIAFVKQKGLSPLMPGQWKAFLAFYAGFWTIQNLVRPLRFALAVAMAPVFDGFMNFVQHRFHLRRQTAFAVYIALLGITTVFFVFGSIRLLAGPLAYSRVPPP